MLSILGHLITLTHLLTPEKYYKPWELLPGDEAIIKRQIGDAEDVIQKEISQFEAENPPEAEEPTPTTNGKPSEPRDPPADPPSETVGSATTLEDHSNSVIHSNTNIDPKSPDASNIAPKVVESSEALKDNGDDAGEIVLEGEEDTVIY